MRAGAAMLVTVRQQTQKRASPLPWHPAVALKYMNLKCVNKEMH